MSEKSKQEFLCAYCGVEVPSYGWISDPKAKYRYCSFQHMEMHSQEILEKLEKTNSSSQSSEWIKKMAELEDGCPIGVGGLMSKESQDEVIEVSICEVKHIYLHVNKLYRFRKTPGCKECDSYVDSSDTAVKEIKETKGSFPGDWPEDAADENGSYMNLCRVCNREFVGHKRRLLCKVCYEKKMESDSAKTFREAAKHCSGEMFGEQAAIKPPSDAEVEVAMEALEDASYMRCRHEATRFDEWTVEVNKTRDALRALFRRAKKAGEAIEDAGDIAWMQRSQREAKEIERLRIHLTALERVREAAEKVRSDLSTTGELTQAVIQNFDEMDAALDAAKERTDGLGDYPPYWSK